MTAQWLLLVLLVSTVHLGVTSHPNSTATDGTKPLYLLTLVPMYPQVRFSLLAAEIAQEEINNRSDILPGYRIELIKDTIEICSSIEAGIGLSKLVKYTVNPPCRPVVAVMGLECSSHTSVISPVAGHKGFDLIQLSRAISPIFKREHERFPHLWRFIGAASVYSDIVLAMMDQFNWTRIGIVYNIESSLYSELANDIQRKIRASNNKTVAFNSGIRGTKAYYLDTVISNIKSSETGVLVKLISQRQTHALLSLAYRHGLIYPHYTWIHVATHPTFLTLTSSKAIINKHARGHIFLFIQDESKDTFLVSNQTFSEYIAKYRAFYQKELQPLFNISFDPILVETHYYDQVWAIALAINNSLTEQNNRNLSIDNYTIGQPEITAVIEEQMKNLRFQGASGWIEFNQYRSVSTPIEVLYISNNAESVGLYNPLHPSDFHITLNASDLPGDTVPRVIEYILISLPVAIVLYIVTGCVIFFTTIQLVLYLVYRHHKVIKATSPFLSLFMFLGCYLFCAAAILLIIFASFVLSPETFTAMAITHFIFIINGTSLVLIILFIKQLRVYRVFTCWSKDFGKQWNSCKIPFLVTFLLLLIVPNIALTVLVILKPPTHSTYYYRFFRGNLPVIEIHTRIEPTSNYSLIGLAVICIIVFLTLVFYMGVRNRKIKMKNFNSSGQVFLLLAVLVITICLAISIVIIFLVREQEPVAMKHHGADASVELHAYCTLDMRL